MVNPRIFLLLVMFSGEAVAACGNGYEHCYLLTFTTNPALMGASDLPNYPALLKGEAWMATASHGGQVRNTATQAGGASISMPADFILATDSTCAVKISGWEFEKYDAETGVGSLIHANIGTLTHSSPATVTACVGKFSANGWQGNVSATWDSHYKFVGHMADTAPSTAILDSTGTGNAVNQAATSTRAVSGTIDGALNYPAAGDYATIPPVTLAGAATFSAWVKLSALNGYGRILETEFGSSYALTLDGAGTAFSAYVAGSVITGGTPDTTAWHHLAFSYDGAQARFFVDGVLTKSGALAAPGSHTLPVYIGTWDGSPGGYGSQGIYDEVRISDTGRTADQVLADYHNQASPATFYTVGPDLGDGLTEYVPSARHRIL